MAYAILPAWGAEPADALIAAAVAAAQQALTLDSTLSDARLALAQARFSMLQHSAAESLFVGVVGREPQPDGTAVAERQPHEPGAVQ